MQLYRWVQSPLSPFPQGWKPVSVQKGSLRSQVTQGQETPHLPRRRPPMSTTTETSKHPSCLYSHLHTATYQTPSETRSCVDILPWEVHILDLAHLSKISLVDSLIGYCKFKRQKRFERFTLHCGKMCKFHCSNSVLSICGCALLKAELHAVFLSVYRKIRI